MRSNAVDKVIELMVLLIACGVAFFVTTMFMWPWWAALIIVAAVFILLLPLAYLFEG
jgi:fatty acid desaturase